MKLLDKYLFKQYVVSFLFAIGILAVVSCVIHYSENIDSFVKNHAPDDQIALFFVMFIPHIVSLLYPLFIFISTIFFTSKLAYKSEFIAILASGIPFTRILKPYIIGSILIGSISFTFNHYLVPRANKFIYNFEEQYVRNSKSATEDNVHIKISPTTYLFVNKFDLEKNAGLRFTEEVFDGTLLKEKIFANNVTYIDSTKTWLLEGVTIRTNDGLKETLVNKDTLIKHYKIVPNDFTEDIQRKATLTSAELYIKTDTEMNRGLENINAYSYELHRRSADSFAGIILTIIAVAISTRKIRGGSGLHLAIGIIISAIFLLFMQFSKTFATNSGFNPMLAAWLPNIVFGVVAYFLVKWRSK